jgi:hypothetical protein
MTNGDASRFGYATPYWRFVREERHFCALLAHLLMQRGENVRSFLRLVNSRLKAEALPPLGDLTVARTQDAEIYLEFAFLRDRWNQFDLDPRMRPPARNAQKRAFLFDLFAREPGLATLQDTHFPDNVSEFNERFMGPAGRRIAQDIASPALWPVPALEPLANSLATDEATRKQIFRDLCRFKWAFRIKPDLVLVVPGLPPLCVEAKLMSTEGRYPVNAAECAIFDRLFQPPEHRVRQIELQDFMFNVLLGSPAQQVLVSKGHSTVTMPAADGRPAKVPALSWRQVFDALDSSASLPSVGEFLRRNDHIQDTPLVEPERSPAATESYFDGTANGLEAVLALITERRQQHLRTEVGYAGGAQKLRGGTLDSLASRRWKWHDPATSTGSRKAANWIGDQEFERIVEELQQAEGPDE